jgi:Bacterial DNA-binding protein
VYGITGKRNVPNVVWCHLDQAGGVMTKADIFEKVQAGIGLTKKESAEMVEAVFSVPADKLHRDKIRYNRWL